MNNWVKDENPKFKTLGKHQFHSKALLRYHKTTPTRRTSSTHVCQLESFFLTDSGKPLGLSTETDVSVCLCEHLNPDMSNVIKMVVTSKDYIILISLRRRAQCKNTFTCIGKY